MPIRELINDRLQCCSPEMNVFEATRVMKRYDVGCVVIVEDGKPVGIVTDRDIVLRCVSEGLDLVDTHLSDIMSTKVQVAHKGFGLQGALRLMRNHKVSRVPVVDQNGRVVSIFSTVDMIDHPFIRAVA